jgi:hypothetical protein
VSAKQRLALFNRSACSIFMARLRNLQGGCGRGRGQTFKIIAPYTAQLRMAPE